MKKSYYLFNAGRMSRKDNTFKFVPVNENGVEGPPKYIPIESVDNLYCFGSLDANSALFNFLGKENISVHYFDYYEHYTGSFFPKEYLLSGKVLIAQTATYLNAKKRMEVALSFVDGAANNILKNLRYYSNRGKDTSAQIERIESFASHAPAANDIDTLMGIEGNIRQTYYQAFEQDH